MPASDPSLMGEIVYALFNFGGTFFQSLFKEEHMIYHWDIGPGCLLSMGKVDFHVFYGLHFYMKFHRRTIYICICIDSHAYR
mmetsp:Transcript_1123/g.2215  ORF Transcript_1123/g.2215 Transcript_1123/m.2215 type:complete len:82 (-) Transcript_1123:3141-3386(-)